MFLSGRASKRNRRESDMLTIDKEMGVTVFDNDVPVTVAVTIYAPSDSSVQSDIVYFCVPGGGLSRQYFDLLTTDGQEQYSFARSAAAGGATVVAIDSVGTGQSSAPDDAFTLNPERIADYNAATLKQVLTEAHQGTLHPSMPAIARSATVIGLGHSIGALLLTLQQANHGQFNALALLGFSLVGMPQALPEEARSLLSDAAAREKVEAIARVVHDTPWFALPTGQGAGEIYGRGAVPTAMASLKNCSTRLLATASLAVLIPGLYEPECKRIDVPMFSALGDRDICGTEQDVLTSFPNVRSHEIHSLPETGHTHFVFSSAPYLFEKLLSWGAGSCR